MGDEVDFRGLLRLDCWQRQRTKSHMLFLAIVVQDKLLDLALNQQTNKVRRRALDDGDYILLN